MRNETMMFPHFLRVARSVASARGVRRLALPIAATAALSGACGGQVTVGMSSGEGGGGTTSTGGWGAGVSTMPTTTSGGGYGGAAMGRYDGGPVGDMVGDGGPVGLLPMQDAGSDAP
jgi:hypothetical protein